jgi:hypothetical protein
MSERERLAEVLRDLADDYDEERSFNEALKMTADALRAEAEAVERSDMSDEDARSAIEQWTDKYQLVNPQQFQPLAPGQADPPFPSSQAPHSEPRHRT